MSELETKIVELNIIETRKAEIKKTAKNHTIKNLIEAHGWLGIIISVFLFTVFWAGGISLFRHEVQQWAELPHHPINPHTQNKPLAEIIEEKLKQYPLNTKEHLSILMPGIGSSYYQLSIDLLPKETVKTDSKESGENKALAEEEAEILVDPKTGETIGEADQFNLATFIYNLHVNLNIPTIGTYIVGIVTLFFMFAIFSGVFIHAKKIVSHFFSYRINKQRTQLLDLHNIVGVFSLPFTLMYAITGLLFNLIIVYQISSVVLIYKGDTTALFHDVGYDAFKTPDQTGVALDMTKIQSLLEKTEANYGPARVVRFYNYGDETAVMQILGDQPKYFGKYYDIYYQMRDGVVVNQYGIETNNTFRRGMEFFTGLHFGNYAGIDLRILYFVLAIAVAAMIIAGNFLWINKRNANQNISSRATHFVSNMTIGACTGLIVATAAAFLAERVLPLELDNRPSSITITFVLVLVAITLNAYWQKNKKRFLSQALYVTAGLLLITLAADWIMFSNALVTLVNYGIATVTGIEIGILCFAIVCIWIARLLGRTNLNATQVINAVHI